MVTVGSDYAILFSNRGFHSDGDRFLAVVEMAESANQLRLVERIGSDFHAAHERHVSEEGEELLRCGLNGA